MEEILAITNKYQAKFPNYESIMVQDIEFTTLNAAMK